MLEACYIDVRADVKSFFHTQNCRYFKSAPIQTIYLGLNVFYGIPGPLYTAKVLYHYTIASLSCFVELNLEGEVRLHLYFIFLMLILFRSQLL